MRVRKLGLGALAWRGGSLNGGEVGDVPVQVVEAYAHKLVILDPAPLPEPVTEPKPKAKARARVRAKRAGRKSAS